MEGPPAERLLTGCEIFSWELGRQRPEAGWDRGGVGSSFRGGGMGIPQVVNSMTYKSSEGPDQLKSTMLWLNHPSLLPQGPTV